jgi:hypothetical protein
LELKKKRPVLLIVIALNLVALIALVFAQETVLGQEPGEEHPVPMLVGDLLGQ